MNKDEYMQAKAGNVSFYFRKDDLKQVLYEPVFTRFPSCHPLIYGILLSGNEMFVLLDPAEGCREGNSDFGRMCLVIRHDNVSFAVAASEVTAEIPSEMYNEQFAAVEGANPEDEDIISKAVYILSVTEPEECR